MKKLRSFAVLDPLSTQAGTENNPLPTLEWPEENPPPYWWGRNSDGAITKVYRSYKDYCDD